MKIKDTCGEEGNLNDMSTFSISDKIGFASAATTTFQISEPRIQRKPSTCCAWTALVVYLLLLTVGQGLLAYKVFKMQREILRFQEQNTSYTEEILESSFGDKLLSEGNVIKNHIGHEENWRRILEEEITIIKSSNANLMMRMNNITLIAGMAPFFRAACTVGRAGFQGLQGEKGSKGDSGPAGPSGERGVKGEKGEIGFPGPQGQKGEMGKKGDTGPHGPMGPQGQQGAPGLPGLKGNTGEPGHPGQKGEAGVIGQRGLVGIPGLDGKPGQKGEKGDPGPSGSQGIQGIAGLKGEKGDSGETGKGESNRHDFLAFHPGSPGLTGQKGSKGDSGSQGPKGQPGVKGDKGDRGLSGKAVCHGVCGVDGAFDSFNHFIRIAEGGRRGRVEIFHQGSWGTICDDGWSTQDATVVCRMLGYSLAVSAFTATAGTGRIWLDDVNCSGTERSIFDCPKPDWGVNNCSHSEDAGVECI
ncbi:MARCO protein, partial [Mesembrinibis cayennensis]|nr:MARCO protein [Mesembrinibis cayennensis]